MKSIFDFGSRTTPEPVPAPVTSDKPADLTERREATGIVLRKERYLSSAYTYYHVAILVRLPNSESESVFTLNSSGSYPPYALCRKGDRVRVQLYRINPDTNWSATGLQLDWDIEREKADLGNAAAD